MISHPLYWKAHREILSLDEEKALIEQTGLSRVDLRTIYAQMAKPAPSAKEAVDKFFSRPGIQADLKERIAQKRRRMRLQS